MKINEMCAWIYQSIHVCHYYLSQFILLHLLLYVLDMISYIFIRKDIRHKLTCSYNLFIFKHIVVSHIIQKSSIIFFFTSIISGYKSAKDYPFFSNAKSLCNIILIE